MLKVPDEPKDNRPDVQVESRVRKDADPNNWYLAVEYTATCRFGCGSFHTPDVVQVHLWAVLHPGDESHRLAKDEALGIERKPKPRIGGGMVPGLVINNPRIPSAAQADLDDLVARKRRDRG